MPKNFWNLLLTTAAKTQMSASLISNVQTAYSKTTDGSFVNDLKDVLGSTWMALDWDKDPDPDSVLFFRQARPTEPWTGFKIQGIGHDGQRTSIDKVMEKLKKQLQIRKWWIEASDAMEHILYKDTMVQVITDEKKLQQIFKDPKLKLINDHVKKGRYKRSIGGHMITETTFGLPELR